jgi:adenylate kinase family enzyme
MQRIVIIGVTGSGKTTLARGLSLKTGVDFIDLDDLFWLPRWILRDSEGFRTLAKGSADGQKWVIAGNARGARDIIWGRADTIIWLDYGFSRTLWQLLRRSYRRARNKTLICNGNTETWKKLFSTDSIVIWLFRTYLKHKREFGALFSDPGPYAGKTFVRLKAPAQTKHWLEECCHDR